VTKILHGEPNVYELEDLSTNSCTLKDHSHSPLVCTVRCISVAGIITTVINGAQKAIVKGAQVSSPRLYTMWGEIATTIEEIEEAGQLGPLTNSAHTILAQLLTTV
jgi:hypothetical protein